MDGTLQESGGEETGSSPMLTAPESKWLQSTKAGIDQRTATSTNASKVYIWRQHLAAFLANIPSLATGLSLAWTAPAVPILLGQVEDAQPLRLSLEQASWVGGLMPLASLGGALVAGPLAERVGRKGALLLGALPTLIGWLLMAFAGSSIWLLMLGRALTGMAVGAASGPVSLYCEEIADIHVRGALGSLPFFMNSVGLLVIYTVGAMLPYFWFTVSAAILPVVFVPSFCWMPESPAYLAACGRVSDAQQALRWLRGPDVDFKAEMENMLASRSQAHVFSNTRSLSYICSQRPWQSNSIRALFLILVLMFLQQMSGIGMFTFYLVHFFEQSSGNVSSTLSSVLTGLAFVVGSIGATATVDRIGRRFLLVMSSIIMCISLSTLALYAYFNRNNLNIEGRSWVPLASLITYIIAYTVGLGPIPWGLMAEMLPMYSKGWASPIAVCMNRICMFLVAKESPLLLEHAGEVATYIIFGLICFTSAIFTFFCLPETKGKLKADILKEIGGDKD